MLAKIDRTDVSIPYLYFKITQGRLYKVLASGKLRPVTAIHNGRVVARIDGNEYDAAMVAWTLHYGIWPRYPLVYADGDPHNVREDNLFAAREPLKRCTLRTIGKVIYHPLSKVGHANKEAAREHWQKLYAAELMQDMAAVISQQQEELERHADKLDPTRWLIEPSAKQRKAGRKPLPVREGLTKHGKPYKPKPTQRPKAVEGKKWHWYESAWLLVPKACHVSDDKNIRCHAVKYLNAVEFYYDHSQERTLFRTQREVALRENQRTATSTQPG